MACSVGEVLGDLNSKSLDEFILSLGKFKIDLGRDSDTLRALSIADKRVYAVFNPNGSIQLTKSGSHAGDTYVQCVTFTSLRAYELFSNSCVCKDGFDIQILSLQDVWNQALHAKMESDIENPVLMRIITSNGAVLGIPIVQ